MTRLSALRDLSLYAHQGAWPRASAPARDQMHYSALGRAKGAMDWAANLRRRCNGLVFSLRKPVLKRLHTLVSAFSST